MSSSRSITGPGLPSWLAIPVTVVLTLHLLAIGVNALAAPSGPWITPMGPSMSEPPVFAGAINQALTEAYLKPIKMTHNYHFLSNRTATAEVRFEVKLKDARGHVIKTVKFPEEDVNPWVRHRQTLLALGLAQDEPVQPPQGEVIAAPGQKMPTLQIWDFAEDQNQTLVLKTIEQHQFPRNRPPHIPVMRPSPWSLLLAQSYMRHLCREHGAASAVLIRRTKDAIYPAYTLMDNPPPMALQELVVNFGEMQK